MTKAQSKALGEILIERGVLTKGDLERCVAIQKEQTKNGVFFRLGEILVSEGILSTADVSTALEDQAVGILLCEKCHTQFNVQDYDSKEDYRCRRCRGPLIKPGKITEVTVEDTVVCRRLSGLNALADENSAISQKHSGIAWFGDYEIIGEISRGGMAIVYKARQPRLKRVVALKVLLDRNEASSDDVKRFHQEAVAISALRHPGIVAVFDVGEVNGIAFFTMDYIEGTTLDRAVILENFGPKELAAIFIKICDALDFAHSRKILHHDIKPKNILIDSHNQPIIVDFGIAKRSGEDELSGEFGILGSPVYLAPEYITGKASYDIACEIYSVGTTLYQMLSGRNPNDDIDTKRIFANAATREVAPLRKIANSVSLPLHQIVMTSLAKNPAQRYGSVRALGEDLRRFLEGQEIHANFPSWLLKWRVLRVKVALAMVFVVSIALVFYTGYFARVLSTKDVSIEKLRKQEAHWKREYIRLRLGSLRLLMKQKKYAEAKSSARVFFRACPEANSGEGLELKKKILSQK
jgi:serine/threonine protein kinase